ncbi:hypothetical protein pEaSNUABM37_00196 [Erwinia phage pEa_SNUABM_37]|nr:hypothetical protein pEaSNUABM37_00196 [Erwinia phage pEa_SNUABM_37]QXO10666.1 hypothetical protein pEaSNUABM48_00196 [Erwinia phage pEa_SNUABM_48]
MAINFDRVSESLDNDVSVGMHNLAQTLSTIEAYQADRLSAGVESFDSPADQSFLASMADMFPDHFEIDSGNEGLSELAAKIKKGLSGIKDAIKKGIKPKADPSVLKEAKNEVRETYDNNFFKNKNMVEPATQIKVGALQNYVGKGNKAQVLAAIAKNIPLSGAAVNTYLKETFDYWRKSDKYVSELKKLDKDDLEGAGEILTRVREDLKSPFEVIKVTEAPWETNDKLVGADSTLDALSDSEAETAVDLINKIIEEAQSIQFMAQQIIQVGGFVDCPRLMPHFADDKVKVKNQHVLYNFLSWEGYTMPGNIGQATQMAKLVDVARLLERWVNSSIK